VTGSLGLLVPRDDAGAHDLHEQSDGTDMMQAQDNRIVSVQ
jgi:hypothetical protein